MFNISISFIQSESLFYGLITDNLILRLGTLFPLFTNITVVMKNHGKIVGRTT